LRKRTHGVSLFVFEFELAPISEGTVGRLVNRAATPKVMATRARIKKINMVGRLVCFVGSDRTTVFRLIAPNRLGMVSKEFTAWSDELLVIFCQRVGCESCSETQQNDQSSNSHAWRL
jgi:hypothetical protein